MFFNILKKDLKRKKSMNLILFVFIVLCATFMASSVNNLTVITNAIDYFEQKSNIADFMILSPSNNGIDDWLVDNPLVKDSQKDTGILLSNNDIKPENSEYDLAGSTMLFKISEKYNLLLNESNESITEFKSGEMALSYYEANRNGLKIGDKITVTLNGKEKIFTLTVIMKDILFGTQFFDTTRILISEEDYDYFMNGEVSVIDVWSTITDNPTTLSKQLQKQDFFIYYSFDITSTEATFTMDKMTASILTVVSVCLIVIVLVILRFTIVFTLQEDYREIGIMKAIGLRNSYIKKIYIIKYFVLSFLGSAVGIILSVPFSGLLTEKIKNNIAMESASGNLFVNIVCGFIIIILVVLFCYLSTGKVNKFTAIQAIRSGSTGERFKSRRHLFLNRRGKLSTVVYLALNSIFNMLKSYSILVITFIMGTLLVIMPLNAVNTLNSDDIVEFFGILKTDVYIEITDLIDYANSTSVEHVKEKLEELQKFYKEKGVDIKINAEVVNNTKVYVDDSEEILPVMSWHSIFFDIARLNCYTSGTPPQLPNEVAMAEVTMKELDVKVGDNVNIIIGDTVKSYSITASYQSMNNMGRGLIFSTKAEVHTEQANGIFVQGDFVSREDIEGQISKLKEVAPEYKVQNPIEFISMWIGGIADIIDAMKTLILMVVLFINCLITVLLMRTFITKESGEISLMKNIGFKNRSIKLWQSLRIIITLFVSIIVGMVLSNPFNVIMAKYTFGIMGALNMKITVNAFEVYFFYPIILFLGTSIAAFLSTVTINRINFREINNAE